MSPASDPRHLERGEERLAALVAELDRIRGVMASGEPPESHETAWLDQIEAKIDRLRTSLQDARTHPGQPVTLPRGGFVNGAPAVTPQGNALLMAMSPEDLARTDLTVGDTRALFSPDYMRKLRDQPIAGVDDPDLKTLMREIEKGLSNTRKPEVMAALERIVGIPPDAARLAVDHERFELVRKQQQMKGPEPVPPLDEEMHPDFRASRSQLLFGKVLGDAFGIHEVFAALLSPTGGLVGPGNWLLEGKVKAGHLAPDNPVALHGTVHDAAGYLLNNHSDGPGYNYLESNVEYHGTTDPYSGQASGIAFWVSEVGKDYVDARIQEAQAALEKRLQPIRDTVTAEIEKRMEQARAMRDDGVRDARRLMDDARQTLTDIDTAIEDARRTWIKGTIEDFETTSRSIGEGAARDASALLETALNFMRS